MGFIQSKKSKQNTYIEYNNWTVRYDWPNQHFFEIVEEVQRTGNQMAMDIQQ